MGECADAGTRKGSEAMDVAVIRSYLPLFQEAGWLTLRLGLMGIALAIVVGLICAAVHYWRIPVLNKIVTSSQTDQF